jgi:hypothetical protein
MGSTILEREANSSYTGYVLCFTNATNVFFQKTDKNNDAYIISAGMAQKIIKCTNCYITNLKIEEMI